MPKKIGLCINVGGQCPKALKREKQEADVTNFKCAHCGSELREFKGSTGPDWKKIAIGGVAVAVLLGGGAYFAFSGDKSSDAEPTQAVTVVPVQESETKIEDNKATPKAIENKPNENPVKKEPTKTTGTLNLSYGKYTGEIKNGKPNGQGRLVYTKEHLINKNDLKGRMAQSGESVQGIFVNGEITIGQYFDEAGNLISSLNFGVAD